MRNRDLASLDATEAAERLLAETDFSSSDDRLVVDERQCGKDFGRICRDAELAQRLVLLGGLSVAVA